MKRPIIQTVPSVSPSLSIRRRAGKYRYFRDRLFLACVAVYLINRFVAKPLLVGEIDFFACYLNDLICIPFCLPIVLFVTRAIRLRDHDRPPGIRELCFFLILWSYYFEVVAPSYGARFNYMVRDPWDVFFYALGCLIAGVYWNHELVRIRHAEADSIKASESNVSGS